MNLEEYIRYHTKRVNTSGKNIANIQQYDELCELAIAQDGMAIQYIKNKKKKYIVAAIEQNGKAIQFVDNPTIEMYCMSVKQSRKAIKYIKNINYDMYMMFAKINGMILRHIICDIYAKLTLEQINNICFETVKQNWQALKYVKKQNEEINKIALEQTLSAIKFIKKPSMDLCIDVLQKDGMVLQFIKNPDHNMFMTAVKQNGLAIQYVPKSDQTYDICLNSVKQNGLAIQYCNIITNEIMLEAVKQNGGAIYKMCDLLNLEICTEAITNPIFQPSYGKKINLDRFDKNRLLYIPIMFRKDCEKYVDDQRFYRTKSVRNITREFH